jgi:hypothetical protein
MSSNTKLICKIDQIAVFLFEFQNSPVQAMDSDERIDKKIDGGTHKNRAKNDKDICPMHYQNESMVSKGRDQKPNRRYLCKDDSYPQPNGFQGCSLLLERGLNFFDDQRVFIFSVIFIH